MFHVPEGSRLTIGKMASDASYGNNGVFIIDSPEPGWQLATIVADGSEEPEKPDYAWEHVSVQAIRMETIEKSPCYNSGYREKRFSRIPTWKEMCFVKDMFWDAEDVVVQYHPRRSEYVNCHPNVLHLWRPKLVDIPTPPPILVGVMNKETR